MGFETDQATIEWENEVDAECARLIRDGVSPWSAGAQARRIVSRRRRMTGVRIGIGEYSKGVVGAGRQVPG